MLRNCLAATLVLAQVVGFFALPRPADAALSADPNAEIVYIDDRGVIRVLDTQGNPLVTWFSPDGGWDEIALADINDDGDMEILALDDYADQGNETRIAVFDPVIARGTTDKEPIGGIPWDKLWEIRYGGQARWIVGGNFDPNIAGDEMGVGFSNGSEAWVQIWNANSLDSNQKPTGRDWKRHIEKNFADRRYTYAASGQIDNEGADELVLIDSESGTTRLDIFRPDRDLERLGGRSTDSDKFNQAAVGQIRADDEEEIAAILTTDEGDRQALVVYEVTDDDEVEVDESWAFAPNPESLFLADITGNGDKEVFFTRKYTEDKEGPRLIMRDEWGNDSNRNEDLIEWNLMDGGSRNEFRGGAGGDVDGDGRDEVIIMRDDRIRVYRNPENGREGSSEFTDYRLNTNRSSIVTGDLDRNGFNIVPEGPALFVDKNVVETTLPAGTISQEFTVDVANVGNAEPLQVNVVFGPNSSWARVNSTLGTTPFTFRFFFDATNLEPGMYETTATLTVNRTDVQNNNFIVYLRLTVVPPSLQPIPPVLSWFRACEASECTAQEREDRTKPFTSTVDIRGSSNLTFRAAIIGVPEEDNGSASVASAELASEIAGGEIDADGNMVLFDADGNRRVLGADWAGASAVRSTTVIVDPELTWISSATLDTINIPAELTIGVNPAHMTEDYQREYAVLVLVADTRAGTPAENVVVVPIQLANVGDLMWASFLRR
jgi:hypothetical protein